MGYSLCVGFPELQFVLFQCLSSSVSVSSLGLTGRRGHVVVLREGSDNDNEKNKEKNKRCAADAFLEGTEVSFERFLYIAKELYSLDRDL